MTAASSASFLPFSRPLTRDDLEALPGDDGHRYELIDGVLIVTPGPDYGHQSISGELHVLLRSACPDDLKVLYAPYDVVLAMDTVVQPDLMVAPRSAFTRRELPVAPLLAVEILSPSTRRIDLMLKRSRYEAAGCPSYWVVDPVGPRVTAWELRDGAYVLAGEATGEQSLTLGQPFEVTLVPNRLIG